MKKIAVLFSLCALFAALLLSCGQDIDLPPDITPPVTSDTNETTPAETLPPVTSDTNETTPPETTAPPQQQTFPEVLAAEIYDPEEIYAEGTVWVERFYPDCEIVCSMFLRSLKTGYSAYVLFDLVDDSEQYKILVYDGEKKDFAVGGEGGPRSSMTPYRDLEDNPDEYPALSERIRTADPDEVYYFYYPPLSFACGILNSDGTVDVYRLNGYDGTYITITTFEAP